MQCAPCGDLRKIDSVRQTRFHLRHMNRFFMPLCAILAAVLLAGCATTEDGPANRLDKADVLPLALDDNYMIGKILLSTFDPSVVEPITKCEPVMFERLRLTWGAIDQLEVSKRHGNYYTIYWKSAIPSDVTMRLEYRQAGLGNFVMAQERSYSQACGTYRSTFEVTGDDYLEAGCVTSWRIVLIKDRKIIALGQSFLWK
jgi:hypothetical protein